MLRIVLDNNQNNRDLDKLASTKSIELVVPSFVLIESILGSFGEERLARLRKFENLRIGLEPVEVFDQISQKNVSEIMSVEPCEENFELPLKISDDLRVWAQGIKDKNLDFCKRMKKHFVPILQDALRKDESAAKKKLRFFGLDDAIEGLGVATARECVLDSVTNAGRRVFAISDANALYDGLIKNPYLALFFRAMFFYLFSFSGLWEGNTNWNFSPKDNNDFWSDLTLFLVVGDGAVILTEDTRVKSTLSVLRPSAKAMNVDEVLNLVPSI